MTRRTNDEATTTADLRHAPPTSARARIPEAAIDDLVDQIAAKFNPQKIILFGSYAYGTPNQESDLELLVVMEAPQGEIKQYVRVRSAVAFHHALDLLVPTPETLAKRLELGDYFLREVAEKGRAMYASPPPVLANVAKTEPK